MANQTIYKHIGEKIRELRMRQTMSQENLASVLGVGSNTISRWETGTYKTTPEDLDKIARFFHVSITVFFPQLEPDSGRLHALTSATGGLNDLDFEEVIRYAEFRKARRALENAKAPKRGKGKQLDDPQ